MQIEREQRETYRNEMLALIKKQKKHKGLLTREGTQPSGQLPLVVPAAQKRQVEIPAQVAKRASESTLPPAQLQESPSLGQDRAEGNTAVRITLPVEVDGRILWLQIRSDSTTQDVINDIKQLHGSQTWSMVRIHPLLTHR
jgi:hypothetical protein